MADKDKNIIGIVGAGSIGIAFAITFARAGHKVRIYDPDVDMRQRVPLDINEKAQGLASLGLLDDPIEALINRVSVVSDLSQVTINAQLVVECAPENLEIKKEIFEVLDSIAAEDVILSSASSAIPVSRYVENLRGKARCLICHPGNPPYLIPLIEIVPAPFTAPEIVDHTIALFSEVGLKPILVNKEVEGFVFNRLQGALLREAYCLVRDNVASVEDIDSVVRDGLGLRWSVIGPFETADLNTRGGIASHAHKMGPAYARMGAERGQHDPWTPDLISRVEKQRRSLLPLDKWEERVIWRDKEIASLIAERKKRIDRSGGI